MQPDVAGHGGVHWVTELGLDTRMPGGHGGAAGSVA
jgi:hypothetical protein